MKNRIVVGYDGSASSVAAADWAAQEAEIRHALLTIVSCSSTPIGVEWRSAPDAELGTAESLAREFARCRANLECEALDVMSPPREALIDASADADLVVVGKTGAGAAKALMMGSVSHAVVRRSRCPAVVVPLHTARRAHSGVVVVGVDGSPASDAALEWATGEAELRDAELRVVLAWSYTSSGPASGWEDAHDAARAEASSLLRRLIASAEAAAPGCAVNGTLVEGIPAEALLEQSRASDLLVVGASGRGGLRTMLFGSVARAVTDGASCPTVVIHPTSSRH